MRTSNAQRPADHWTAPREDPAVALRIRTPEKRAQPCRAGRRSRPRRPCFPWSSCGSCCGGCRPVPLLPARLPRAFRRPAADEPGLSMQVDADRVRPRRAPAGFFPAPLRFLPTRPPPNPWRRAPPPNPWRRDADVARPARSTDVARPARSTDVARPARSTDVARPARGMGVARSARGAAGPRSGPAATGGGRRILEGRGPTRAPARTRPHPRASARPGLEAAPAGPISAHREIRDRREEERA